MNSELLSLTKQLISIKSTSQNEMEIARFISELLNKKKIAHTLDTFDISKYNAEVKGSKKTANVYIEMGKGEQCLVLYSHLDVVKGRESLFEPRIEGDRLYGRGAADMKSSLASLIYVIINNKKFLSQLNKRIVFAFLADEENSATGAKRFVEWAKSRNLRNFYCILMEPSEDFRKIEIGGRGYHFLNLNGNMRDLIKTFQNIHAKKANLLSKHPDLKDGFGPATVELTKIGPILDLPPESLSKVAGKSCHASMPHLGTNAIERAISLGKKITYLASPDGESPNALPSTAEISESNGAHETLPAVANIDIRTNLSASQNQSLLKEVTALIGPNVRMSVRDQGQAFISQEKALRDICSKNLNFEVSERILMGGSDSPYLLELTPHIIAGFGPGSLKVAHTDYEYVNISTLEQTPDVIMQIIRNFEETK